MRSLRERYLWFSAYHTPDPLRCAPAGWRDRLFTTQGIWQALSPYHSATAPANPRDPSRCSGARLEVTCSSHGLSMHYRPQGGGGGGGGGNAIYPGTKQRYASERNTMSPCLCRTLNNGTKPPALFGISAAPAGPLFAVFLACNNRHSCLFFQMAPGGQDLQPASHRQSGLRKRRPEHVTLADTTHTLKLHTPPHRLPPCDPRRHIYSLAAMTVRYGAPRTSLLFHVPGPPGVYIYIYIYAPGRWSL